MSVYSFKITKGKYQLYLTSSDKEFIRDQFAKWVRKTAEYVQKHKVQQCKDIVNSQINAEKEITQQKIDEQLKRMPKSTPPEELLDTNKNLDIFYAPENNEYDKQEPVQETAVTPEVTEPKITQEQNTNTPQNLVQNTGFDNILEKSMQAPQTELSFRPNPTIKKDNAFINFISAKPVEKKIDYLLMTAYYFTQYEQKPRFTLKQLNAKLMQNIAVIIDHSVLQEAINRDYIECLPDLTGLVGASEYRLTAYGEKVLLDD